MTKLFNHLVLDSAPLLNNNFPVSLAENFYTIPSVIEEIRDEASRLRLSQLPFKLEVRDPSPEAVAMVSRFARATGDSAVLSATDLKVIALAVSLELEKNGQNSKMRKEHSDLPREQTHEGAREYYAAKNGFSSGEKDVKKNNKNKKKGGVEVDFFDENPVENLVKEVEIASVSDADDDSDGEWITPDNIEKHSSKEKPEWTSDTVKPAVISKSKNKNKNKKTNNSINNDNDSQVRIACITSDFAMQNVLLQMKLELYTPDGCRVKSVKNWLLRCHGCFATTRKMDSRFCEKCGGPTLIRTSYMIDEEGACHLFLRSDFQYNLRGTIYSLPTPKGGRKGASLILREDQKEFQRQKEHYDRIQGKIQKQQESTSTMEAIDDRIAAVFGGGTISQTNRRYDAYDGLAPPTVGHGRRNPNALKKK